MPRTRLSVNLNKIALIRNARGAGLPNLVQVAQDCEGFGAEGITVHPRPDERHVRYADIPLLKEAVKTEFNIEGNPTKRFLDMVLEHRPDQCTLVPDDPSALTSDAGWDTQKHESYLKDIIAELQAAGIRVSIFVDPEEAMIEGAKATGADRIEFYTGAYANYFFKDKKRAIEPFVRCSTLAGQLGIGVNAGHDLNLHNLTYLNENLPELLEVSIGHALVSDALYFGLHNTIQMYLKKLQ